MDNQLAYDYTHEAIARAILYKRSLVIAILQESGVVVNSNINKDDLTTAVLTAIGKSKRFHDKILPILEEVMIAKHAADGRFATGTPAANHPSNGALTLHDFTMPNKRNATGETRHYFTGYKERILNACGDEPTDICDSDGNYLTMGDLGLDAQGNALPVVVKPSGSSAAADSSASDNSPSFFSKLFDASFVQSLLKTGVSVVAAKVGSSSNQTLAQTAAQIEAEKTKQLQAQAALAAKGGTKAATMSTGVKIAIGVGAVAIITTIIFLVAKKPTTE